MLVKTEARILIFPGTDFHFPSTSVPPGTFLGSDAIDSILSCTCSDARAGANTTHRLIINFAHVAHRLRRMRCVHGLLAAAASSD